MKKLTSDFSVLSSDFKAYPCWWDTVPETGRDRPVGESRPPLPARIDVAVIGAGYTGLSAARELASRGATVLVLERERIGWGASSRNGGQVLTGLALDPAALVARFGKPRARELFQISLDALDALERLIADEDIRCDYVRCGHVQAASKPSHFAALRSEQALLASVFDHPVHLVSQSDQRSEIGSDAYFGAIVDERSGALNPARYVAQLAAVTCRAGAHIAEGAAVTAVGRRGAHWIVTTERGEVEAGEVLVATNGYTDRIAPWLQRRLVPVGSYVIATEPLPPEVASALLPRRRSAFDSRHFLHYFRLTGDGRLLFGGRAEFTSGLAETTRRCAGILQREMATIFPPLASMRVDYAWSGRVAFTRDRFPHAGRLQGMYFAAGYCGHGVAMATYLGRLIARRMEGERFEHPLFDLRFPAIPLYRGTPWFLPLAGAYYRLKDWLE